MHIERSEKTSSQSKTKESEVPVALNIFGNIIPKIPIEIIISKNNLDDCNIRDELFESGEFYFKQSRIYKTNNFNLSRLMQSSKQ